MHKLLFLVVVQMPAMDTFSLERVVAHYSRPYTTAMKAQKLFLALISGWKRLVLYEEAGKGAKARQYAPGVCRKEHTWVSC